MDRASKSELLKTVEDQKEKLTKYQTKLRDVVAAYKGVLKEKEALESTLQALSTTENTAPGDALVRQDNEGEDSSFSDPLHAKGDEPAQQLVTLTKSLATLTQEKSKMEANYQGDKKILRQEYESKLTGLEDELTSVHGELEKTHKHYTELKSRLRSQQHQHEKEQTDHGMMLKELQKLVAEERMAKEHMEQQVEELRFELEEQKKLRQVSLDYEQQVIELTQQLGSVKIQLQGAQQKHIQPIQEVDSLKVELQNFKEQHNTMLHQEQQRAQSAEQQLQHFSGTSEDRISQLEAKISQLSSVIGDYERLRVQDEQTIVKLREKINQLDLENTALAQTTQIPVDATDTLELPTVMEEFVRLLSKLRELCQDSERSIEDVLNELGLYEQSEDIHTRCKHELEEIKEEFERYKLRAQSVLKSKSSKDPVNKEVEDLKCQLSDFKEKVWQLRAERDEQDSTHRDKLESLSKTLAAVQDKHKQELSSQAAEHKVKMSELDSEMKRHRDRTIALLAEKDKELNLLRRRDDGQYSPYRQSSPPYRHSSPPYRQMSSSSDQDIFEAGASSELEQQGSAVTELLSRTSLLSATPAETSLLHFAQEQARKEVEVQTLRKHKHSIESALRDLQHSASMKEQHLLDQVEFLKEEVRKQQRNISRENANLEYLKNVVYHYMVCNDTVGRNQMLNAISTILQFSPKEKNAVQDFISKSWFSYNQKK